MSGGQDEACRLLAEAELTNPFVTTVYLVGDELRAFGNVSSFDRLNAVKAFTVDQCERALAMPDLQGTVRSALERRIRKLQRESGERSPLAQ